MNNKIEWKPLIISVAISLGAGVLGSLLAPNMGGTYTMMERPPLAPPSWLFPVVWTILYVLMGIAAYRIWLSPAGEERRTALTYYVVQLVVNILWPLIFFEWQAYWLAFLWLVLLWYLVFVTWQKFKEIDRRAGVLLVPYLVWLTFAGYLNLAIAVMQ